MIKEIQLTSHSIFPKQSRVFMLCILFYFFTYFCCCVWACCRDYWLYGTLL